MALGFGVPVALAGPKGDSNLARHDGGPRRGRCAMQHSSECCTWPLSHEESGDVLGSSRCCQIGELAVSHYRLAVSYVAACAQGWARVRANAD